MSAIAALVIAGVVMTSNTLKADSLLPNSSQVSTDTITAVMTTTYANGSTSVITVIPTGKTGCSNDCLYYPTPAQSTIAIVESNANSASKQVAFTVKSIGTVDVTLAGATITGDTTNRGFNSTLSMSLQPIQLKPNETTHIVTPVLPNLTVGDMIEVKVLATVGTFAVTALTVTP